ALHVLRQSSSATAVGASSLPLASSSNSTMLSISVPIAMLVTRSRITSITTGTRYSAIQRCACSIAGSISSWRCTRTALQPKPSGTFHVIHPVAAGLRSVDVLEGKRYAVVHVEPALRLADQTQVRVIDHDVDVGQLELRPHRQLLDHELEIVVPRERDDAPRR